MGAERGRRRAATAAAWILVPVTMLVGCTSAPGTPEGSSVATSTDGSGQPTGTVPVTVSTTALPKPGQVPHFWAALLHDAIATHPSWQGLSGVRVDADVATVEDQMFAHLVGATPAVLHGARLAGRGGAAVSPAGESSGAAVVTAEGVGALGISAYIGLGVTMGYAADAASRSGASGNGATGTVADKVNGVDVSGSLTIMSGGIDMTVTLSKGGATYSMHVRVTVTGDPCPDAQGKVDGSFDVLYDVGGGAGADSGGGSVSIKGTVTVTVDDNAEISSVVSDGSMTRRTSVNGAATTDSVGLHTSLDANLQGQNVVTTHRITTPGQAAADQMTSATADALNGIVLGLVDQRRRVWQGGACVAVTADLPDKVKRASSTPFTVKVTHKPDGAELDAPVTAKLDSGAVSVSPDRIDKAPGQFTYVAPDAAGKKASLTFTSKSRRGIGTLTLTVSTMRYVARGGSGPVSITGTVDDLQKPFDLKVTSPGAVGTVTLTPTSATTGTIKGTSTLAFSSEVTTGTYTLKETATGYVATGTVTTCLTIVKTCSPPGRVEVTFTAE